MLKPRIIPVLLLRDGGLVKTTKFSDPRYIGDPLNAVKIFNEKNADELIVLDIDATTKNSEPNYRLIEKLANECRMPLCYGGGIKNLNQANRILGFGVEKIVVSSLLFEEPDTINKMANYFGNQSIVVSLDLKKPIFSKNYEFFIHNGKEKTGKTWQEMIPLCIKLGVGEVLINIIERDGLMCGYDLELLKLIQSNTSVPITILGGAGNLSHISEAISALGIIGVAAGSLFIYKGIHKAVLINYPNKEEKKNLYNSLL